VGREGDTYVVRRPVGVGSVGLRDGRAVAHDDAVRTVGERLRPGVVGAACAAGAAWCGQVSGVAGDGGEGAYD
jgi:hypothetical protein